jgi:hypothetical protein
VDTVYINRLPSLAIRHEGTLTAPADVTLISGAVDHQEAIVSQEWRFEDDEIGTVSGSPASVRFDDPGDYPYELVVVDASGGIKRASGTITIDPP